MEEFDFKMNKDKPIEESSFIYYDKDGNVCDNRSDAYLIVSVPVNSRRKRNRYYLFVNEKGILDPKTTTKVKKEAATTRLYNEIVGENYLKYLQTKRDSYFELARRRING